MKKFLLLTAIASVASVAAVAPVMAQTTTAAGVVTVNSTTTKLCTKPSDVTVSLGEYNGTLAVGPISGAVTFRCTNTTPATVAFSSASTPLVAGGGNLTGLVGATPIAYTYTTTGTVAIGTGLALAANDLTSTALVSIAAGQNPVPTTYTDTINVTVSY